MYNMEISIGSYKCRLEICILTVVLFWVAFGHVMCSCCTMTLREGATACGMYKYAYSVGTGKATQRKCQTNGTCPDGYTKKIDNPMKLLDCKKNETQEGFVNANNKGYGPEFGGSKSAGYILSPDTWSMPTLSYSKGTVPSTGAQDILNRNNPPLAEGEMDLFANTPFKPECCPNTYSNSEGCACMDMNQYNMLIHRGSNNVPYSEY